MGYSRYGLMLLGGVLIGSHHSIQDTTYVETIPATEVSFTMKRIAGGTFTIGSPTAENGRDDDEGPQRLVSVEPFWIGIHEVTWDEFEVFQRRDTTSLVPSATSQPEGSDAVVRPSPPYEDPSHGMGTGRRPAVSMTQWAALQYAMWLSEKTGKFYRLPTEAEWEYACRAGTVTTYSFGDAVDSLDRYSWFWDNSGETYHQVGTREPNPWGLYDMHGNVSEWTLDQYQVDFYSTLPDDTTDSPWNAPTSLHPRTVRGGAFDDDPEALRCAARLESSLNWKRRDPQIPKSFWWNTDSPFVGFRLVSPVEPPSPDEQAAFWLSVLGG